MVRAASFGLLLLAILGEAAETPGPKIRFQDVGPDSGVDFILQNSPTPEKFMIETMAGGLALFDYDGDGRPDLFFTNGAAIPSLQKSDPKFRNRLYHNEGRFHFRDVTSQAGVAGEGYSMGAAVADYDGDGKPDLFVAGVNRNILYRNRGDGTFTDVTEAAGLNRSPSRGQWAVAAGWFDYDRDGLLDLWVVHYAKFSTAESRYCGDRTRDIRIYCHPKYFQPLANTLYRNLGHGRFEDVSEKAGIAGLAGRGMSVAFADYDGDGYPDVFVTNDNMANFLFHNRRNGTFEEVGLLAGVALREDGKPVASMGADFRDYNNDGWPDLSFTALAAETFPLFKNNGKGAFDDATYSSHMGALSLRHSGWGVGLVDFDNDGWKDLFVAASHVNDRVEAFEPAVYREPNRVFANLQNGTFADASEAAGLSAIKAHRGSAFADLDGDGREDVVVTSLGEPVEIWRNQSTGGNHWLNVRLIGLGSNRDGLGARLHIGQQWNEMTSAVSYASSVLGPVHFGLGSTTAVPELEVIWPDGKKQIVRDVRADQLVTVRMEDAR